MNRCNCQCIKRLIALHFVLSLQQMAKFQQSGGLGWNDLVFSCFSSSPGRCVKYFNNVLPCGVEIFIFLGALAGFFLGGGGLTSWLSLSLAVAANTWVFEEVKLMSAFLFLKMGKLGGLCVSAVCLSVQHQKIMKYHIDSVYPAPTTYEIWQMIVIFINIIQYRPTSILYTIHPY